MKTAVVLALFMLTECAIAQSATDHVACIKKPEDKTATLSWIAPADTDNISHYSVTHTLPDGTELDYLEISETSIEVPLFERGRHRFTVKTHTKDKKVSAPSASVCKEI